MIDPVLAKRITLVGIDVDGTMTDGGLYIGAAPNTLGTVQPIELKRFDIQDGLGIGLLKAAGLVVAIITGRASEASRIRAQELCADAFISVPAHKKLAAFEAVLHKYNTRWEESCFIGDDLPDVPILQRTGLPVAVANATSEVREIAHHKTKARGRDVLEQEAAAVSALARRLDQRFADAVELLATHKGRVVVSGVGKSGAIARKIAATLTSTGTPATFLHPVDSVHGDLGIVGREDVAIVLSKSGETGELLVLVDQLKRLGVPIVAMTGVFTSTLAKAADVVLDVAVDTEACPFDLAPTTSTTVTLALGDALAIALLEKKGFKSDDFARLHPGGALGRRLLLTVKDVMVTENVPALAPEATMRECVILLAERRGTVAIVDKGRKVLGVVTAGDLTRLMEKGGEFLGVKVGDVMTRAPKLARESELAGAALYRLEQHAIMAMPVVDEHGVLVGIVHLHDLMRAGAA